MKKALSILAIAILTFGCTQEHEHDHSAFEQEIAALRAQVDSLTNLDSRKEIATFLTFQKGDAEEAMNFYLEIFEHSEIVKVKRWGAEMNEKEGEVMHATFTLDGNLFMCSDSPAIHDWDFTPAVSNFIECDDETELESLFSKLSENGSVMMPIDNYGFSQKFGFVQDQFGISWQLNLK
ncbi:MAG: VOC family protein [Bacteroidota bacterium]